METKPYLSIRSTFSRVFGLMGQEALRLGPVLLLGQLPAFAVGLFLRPYIYGATLSLQLEAIFISLLVISIQVVLSNAALFAVFHTLVAMPVTLSEALSASLGRFWATWGLALMIGLIAGLGFVLLLIPGFMVVCTLMVSMPALIVGNQGVFASMKRSRELTKGYRWKIFGILAVIILVTIVLTVAYVVVLKLTGLLPMVLLQRQPIMLLSIIQMVESAAAMLFFCSLHSVLYEQLRAFKQVQA